MERLRTTQKMNCGIEVHYINNITSFSCTGNTAKPELNCPQCPVNIRNKVKK